MVGEEYAAENGLGSLRRRRFLRTTAGTTLGIGAAGCLGDSDTDETENEEESDDSPPGEVLDRETIDKEIRLPDVDTAVTTDSLGEGVIYQYFHTPWEAVEDDLDLLAGAGIDAVWLPQPAQGKLDFQHLATADQMGFYEPEHPDFGHLEPHPPLGYQPVDLREFDSAFGTEAELSSLIDSAHGHGIEVIVDTVLNHVANPDPAPADRWGDADDPLARTRLDWPQFETEEHFTHVPADDYRGDIEDPQYDESLLALPNLDVTHPEVQAAHEAYLQHIADLGIDGVRFDAAFHIWPWYFEEVINPLCDDLGLWRVGEVWDEHDTSELQTYVETGMNAYDFPLYGSLVDALEGEDLRELGEAKGRGLVYESPESAVTFAQNHDTAGPGVGPENPEGELMALANALILSYPGTPHLFRTTIGEDLEREEIRELIDVKHAFARGALIDRHLDEDVYVYEREDHLLAGITVAESEQSRTVETSWEPGTVLLDYTENGQPLEVGDGGKVTVTVPARGWVMYAVGE